MRPLEKFGVGIVVAIIILLLIILVDGLPFHMVSKGRVGYLIKNREATKKLDEGINWKIPVFEKVITEYVGISTITLEKKLKVKYRINSNKSLEGYKTLGLRVSYEKDYMFPTITSFYEETIEKYTYREIRATNKVAELKQELQTKLNTLLSKQNKELNDLIIIEVIALENYRSEKEKDNERKEQLRIAELIHKVEADGIEKTSLAKVEAMKREAAILQEFPELIHYRAIEKWDGKLPAAMQKLPFDIEY